MKRDCFRILRWSDLSGSSPFLYYAGYDPVEHACVRNINHPLFSWNNVRPYVGLVPPADLIFRDTIEANICMAMEPDRERLEKCAVMANISRYIEGQQERYNTVIGDGKQALSSGQEQRIGIARTLYQGADILLFDEPTANLDVESIDVFLDTLDKVASERICIVVTHDPKVVERCSQVFEMTEGGLIARNA